jgi:hypothetical protein
VNLRPCQECVHYDAIVRGDKRRTRHGWCAVKSEYPAVEPQGRLFPHGVKRVASGERASPLIVVGAAVVSHCTQFRGNSSR